MTAPTKPGPTTSGQTAANPTAPPVGVDDAAALARRHVLALDVTAWQLLLPESACVSHLTSAILRGWWLPPLPGDLPVFIAQSRTHCASERPELRVTRHRHEPAWDLVDDVRLASIAETLLACARDLGLVDLVVLIDCVLHHGLVTLSELVHAARARRRGAPMLRRALALADGRSESAWETLLRLLHVLCEIPVEPQHEVHDPAGRLVARGDLWLEGSQMLHEYDGGVHLKRPRQRKDLARSRRLGHADWERRGYTREDVLHQATGILRDADATLDRPHDPTRIRVWHGLLRESLFTPAGMEGFRRRIGLPSTIDDTAG